MSFKEWLMYVKHINPKAFHRLTLECQRALEHEYEIEYGY